MFSDEEDILLGGNLPPEDEMERLLELMTGVLTLRDACDISHCLDFYRYPEETDQSPEEWPYTPTGRRLKQAKYRGIRSAASALKDALVDFIVSHPGLVRSEAVAAMPPSSRHGGRPDCPADWAEAIADALGATRAALWRTRSTRPQKDIDDLEDRVRNQRGSMAADPAEVSGRSVLVVDDLYTHGSSMEEAGRVLRQAGAASVFGLCVVKTVKGCRGYPF
jgi:predicted amidophosphoribosyltransferase